MMKSNFRSGSTAVSGISRASTEFLCSESGAGAVVAGRVGAGSQKGVLQALVLDFSGKSLWKADLYYWFVLTAWTSFRVGVREIGFPW